MSWEDYIEMKEPEGPGFVMYRGYTKEEALASVGKGWSCLIEQLFKAIGDDGFLGVDIKVVQVKEKFGTLRIYTIGATDYADGYIHGLEFLSSLLCEKCGDVGTLRGSESNRYWVLTLCDECNKLPHPMRA